MASLGQGVTQQGGGHNYGARYEERRSQGQRICRFFQEGHCRFDRECKFAHVPCSTQNFTASSPQFKPKSNQTPEDILARGNYLSWKNILKYPPHASDLQTAQRLWLGSLELLEMGDKDWQQRLPKDLVDQKQLHGFQHIINLLSMRAENYGNARFIQVARAFLMTITHPALLDCLSVDIYIGDLYNIISGSGGTQAVPFFQNLCSALLNERPRSPEISAKYFEDVLVAMAYALREMLGRIPKSLLHDDLPALIENMKKTCRTIGFDDNSPASHLILVRTAELERMVNRAQGALTKNESDNAEVEVTARSPILSTYPRDIRVPGDRHDNDKADITEIQILPTENEIRSTTPEFLPSPHIHQPHFLHGLERLFDTHFRLLRHDLFGELKTLLGGLLSSRGYDTDVYHQSELILGNAHAHSYGGALVKHLTFTKMRGLEAQISFQQPSQVRRKSPSERKTWWEETKRLEEGSLLCLLTFESQSSSLLFLTVSGKNTNPGERFGLASQDQCATITVKLASRGKQSHVGSLIRLGLLKETYSYLIEFPEIIPATFVPILENLQQMQNLSHFPFERWIIPRLTQGQATAGSEVEVPPPLYARRADFTFDLSPILTEHRVDILSLDPTIDNHYLPRKLEQSTRLDLGQCEALVSALTKEFSLIQGPPGTGKSYLGVQIMRVLVANKSRADLGPIIVVCYTNHALDQFLEQIKSVGIEKIIRIGGHCSSPVIEGMNLRVVNKGESKTSSERYLLGSSHGALEENEHTIKFKLSILRGLKNGNWSSIRVHIRDSYPCIHNQFSRASSDDFTLTGKLEPFYLWTTGIGEHLETLNEPLGRLDDILRVANSAIYRLALSDRGILLDHWAQKVQETIWDDIQEDNKLRQQIAHVYDEVDRRVLETADVIGVTTSGLAKRISVLRHVGAKIVICEEAGEVLEAHMLSTLIPSVQHVIQIGDHQQLRPKVNNIDLSLESHQGALYQLDRSQFERLAVGGHGQPHLPVAQLNVQRRMRPQISALIRHTLYERLADHDRVKYLPDVVGMGKNVFWCVHTNSEDNSHPEARQRSRSNIWEVKMTHALVRHIVRQGIYNSRDIAVLTPYAGQMQKLRAAMSKDFEIVLSERDQNALTKGGFADKNESSAPSSIRAPGPIVQKKAMTQLLRIATVDNFQGEEAKIVIISLVRSNSKKKVGFLKTTNRINVLLSRAQHGMYLIGNSETYSNVPMWSQIVEMLRADDSVGEAFRLCCPRHPETEILVSSPEEFAIFSPEGGCSKTCERRLHDCGHRCLAKCHSDAMHQIFRCPQRCQRLFEPCGHDCPNLCSDPCGLCDAKVGNIKLPCGHIKDQLECYQTVDLSKVKCTFSVQKRVPGCGHSVHVPCCEDVSSELFKCPKPCLIYLACGHQCPGTCGTCNVWDAENRHTTVKHAKCTKICGRRYGTCNHACPKRCHDGRCGFCLFPCEVRCPHSHCDRNCHQPCAPCIQACTWSCEHQGSCTMPCSAPCNRLPCSRRCPKTLPCGHQCPGVCGEICPSDHCQVCSDKQGQRVDMLEFRSFGEIDLNKSPIVVLECGHFFTAETLDGLVGMEEVYTTNGQGEFVGLCNISQTLAGSIPRCPDCQLPIQQYATQRYNRVINHAVIGEMSKRFISNGKAVLRELEDKAIMLEEDFEKSRQELIARGDGAPVPSSPVRLQIFTRALEDRFKRSSKLAADVDSLLGTVFERDQPGQKLYSATIKSIRASQPSHEQMDQLSVNGVLVPSLGRQLALGGGILQLRIEFIRVVDTLEIFKAVGNDRIGGMTPEVDPVRLATSFLESCEKFITDCNTEHLPKLNVEARLYYSKGTHLYKLYCFATKSSDAAKAKQHVKRAHRLLDEAKEMCTLCFRNSDKLKAAVEDTLKLLGREWYEPVTAGEMTKIKAAMLSGRDSISAHSGHWYNCRNGHPFVIGECGMPMEEAACPECGAPVGGQSHVPVAGVTRAMEMER